MPAVGVRARLLDGALNYARRLQQLQQQTNPLNVDFLDNAHSNASSSSISSLSSLSSLSSISISSNTEGNESHLRPVDPIEIDGVLEWLLDDDEEKNDQAHIRRFRRMHKYIQYVLTTRVLEPNVVHKFSQLHLILVLYKLDDSKRFRRNLRVLPGTFDRLLSYIQNDNVFVSTGNREQIPVEAQLAITLYRFGHFGNAASVDSIPQWAGVSAGVVVKSTRRVMVAFSSLHREVMRWATAAEKQEAKNWVQSASCRAWRDGYAMVDGTLIPLADKPAFHGEAYFDRKSNYSLNLQLITLPNLRIIDYVLGHCGSTHDSTAFQDSRAYVEHEELFPPGEWLWADSAYPAETWCVTPFKRPAANTQENTTFNYWVSRVRIRSEHAMGFLKGRFQSLKGLRQQIKDERDHRLALEWIRTCLIIHTLIHDIETEGRHHDAEFDEELIQLGLDGDGAPNEEQGDTHGPGVSRESEGQKWRKSLKRQLFASGVTGR